MQKTKLFHSWTYLSIFMVVLLGTMPLTKVHSQALQTIVGPTAGPGDYFKGPIYRFGNNANTQNYSRYAYIYTAGEPGFNIPSGAKIVKLEWLKKSGGTVTGNNNFNIWLSNTTNSTLPSPSTWSSLESGMTQTYSSSTYQVLAAADQWIEAPFNLAPNDSFVYSGGNLQILTDWGKAGSASGTINFYVAAAVGKSIGFASSSVLTGSSTLSTSSYGNSRPTIRITYVPVPPCAGVPETGPALSSVQAACPGSMFTLSISNTIPGSGVSFEWQSADDANFTSNLQPIGTSSTTLTSQTFAKYYRCIATCAASGLKDTAALLMPMSAPYDCYCPSGATSTADEEIFNFTFGSLNNTSNCTTQAPGIGSVAQLYSNYRGHVTPPNVERNSTVPFSIQIGTCLNFYPNRSAIFIDYNQNSIFEPAERVYSSPTATNGAHIETGSILIPNSAVIGITGLRVITSEQGQPISDTTGQCGDYSWGETEDYLINITPTTLCSGTPNPGNTLTTASAVCPGNTVTLSLENLTTGQGVNYQWYKNNVLIPGATQFSYVSAPISTPETFYCNVSCSFGGTPVNSTPISISIKGFIDCYCPSVAGNDADEDIFEFILDNKAYSTDCNTTAPGPGSILGRYSNFYPLGNIDTFALGNNIPYSIEVDDCDQAPYYGFGTAIWIDYNQDGDFSDPGEQVKLENQTLEGPRFITGNIIIPCTASLGQTAMRITVAEGLAGSTLSSCLSYGFGETEDYKIYITLPQTCPANLGGRNTICKIGSTIKSTFCDSTIAELSVSDVVPGAPSNNCLFQPITQYQWFEVISPIAATDILIPGATNTTYTVSLNSTRTFKCRLTCSGNSAFSNPITIENKALTTLQLSADFGTYCQGGKADTLRASGALIYAYTPVAGLTGTTGPLVFAGPSTTTTYTVTGTNINGCTATATATVVATSLPLNISASSNFYCYPDGTPITISSSAVGNGSITYSYLPSTNLIPNTGLGQTVLASPTSTTTYVVTAFDTTGCSATDSVTITAGPCSTILDVKLFIEGYYNGLNTMKPVLSNQGVNPDVLIADSIDIVLRDENFPHNVVSTKRTVVHTNGIASASFPSVVGSYYIEVLHRNAISTWSAAPVAVSTGFYDFTTDANKAYGDNMKQVEPGVWAFYSGDIVKDASELVDLSDIALVEIDNLNFAFGYVPTDINGDGGVDLGDFPLLEANINAFVFSNHP